MKEYTTVQGDTWDVISKKVYGDERQAIHLMRANPNLIQNVIFPSGLLLEVPALDINDVPSELPPWKQVTENVS